jgi:hypothetical protein
MVQARWLREIEVGERDGEVAILRSEPGEVGDEGHRVGKSDQCIILGMPEGFCA